jgi:hypothetical protein
MFSFCRNDDWSGGESKNGPNEKDQSYDGPPGMDPEGIIESNWDEVSQITFCVRLFNSCLVIGVL